MIVERQDANALAYQSSVTAKMLLGGVVDRPQWATPLIQVLENATGPPETRDWVEEHNRHTEQPYKFGPNTPTSHYHDVPTPVSRTPSSSIFGRKKKPEFPPASWITPPDETPTFTSDYSTADPTPRGVDERFMSEYDPFPSSSRGSTAFRSSVPHAPSSNPFASPPTGNLHSRSTSVFSPVTREEQEVHDVQEEIFSINRSKSLSHRPLRSKPELTKPLLPHEGVARAIALYDFQAAEVIGFILPPTCGTLFRFIT